MGIFMEANAEFRSQELFGMGAPGEMYQDTLHAIAINTRETEFGSLVEPIPITLKTYKQYQFYQAQPMLYQPRATIAIDLKPSASGYSPGNASPVKEDKDKVRPPKKKWIQEYLEEPKSPLPIQVVTAPAIPDTPRNGILRVPSPSPVLLPAVLTPSPVQDPLPKFLLSDTKHEHSRPRTTSHGPPQIPSPPSVGSNGSNSNGSNSNGSISNGSGGSAPRAGTREVHNKLEKNRRAHLKECFELLKRQLPSTTDDKKTSNLSILGSAIRYIQVLRRKERECEHEMERLAREKIASQQRLLALKRDITVRMSARPKGSEKDEKINGQVLGIPISITSSPAVPVSRMESPPHSLNKVRTLPIQITPTTSQVVGTSYGPRHNTLTLTALAPADSIPVTVTQNGHPENGVSSALSTTVMHPAHIQIPLSQMVSSGGLVVGGALQLLPAGLRVVHAPHLNGMTTSENNKMRLPTENGVNTPPPSTESNGVVVSGLTPIVVSQPHLLQTHHTFTHKMVEAQVVKGNVAPLTVSAQYLSATTIMKPVVVVSNSTTPPSTSA